jgi:hypothetical protein
VVAVVEQEQQVKLRLIAPQELPLQEMEVLD